MRLLIVCLLCLLPAVLSKAANQQQNKDIIDDLEKEFNGMFGGMKLSPYDRQSSIPPGTVAKETSKLPVGAPLGQIPKKRSSSRLGLPKHPSFMARVPQLRIKGRYKVSRVQNWYVAVNLARRSRNRKCRASRVWHYRKESKKRQWAKTKRVLEKEQQRQAQIPANQENWYRRCMRKANYKWKRGGEEFQKAHPGYLTSKRAKCLEKSNQKRQKRVTRLQRWADGAKARFDKANAKYKLRHNSCVNASKKFKAKVAQVKAELRAYSTKHQNMANSFSRQEGSSWKDVRVFTDRAKRAKRKALSFRRKFNVSTSKFRQANHLLLALNRSYH